MNSHPLSLLIFLPVVGSLVVALIPRHWRRITQLTGLLFMTLTFALALQLFGNFSLDEAAYQFKENVPWIPRYGITYYVGLDGISLVLTLLTTILSLIALLSSARAIQDRRKEFVVCLLLLECAMLGTFAAIDLFLFYIFWEAMLIPMYFLIGIFGGARRIYATLKFFLFTMAGSVLMLVAILALYSLHWQQFGFYSTAIPDFHKITIPFETQAWLFGAFALAFAIKIPLFPFHTWLPDAHVEAPTAGSVLLAGILLKMGGYGLVRLGLPLFPVAAHTFAPVLGLLAVVGIIYGAFVALAQEDMKKLVAYSSVSHMGFVVLGLASLTSMGVSGAVFQMVAHGLSTGALFLLVGMLYERRHTRMLGDFGGLAKVMPRFTAAFIVITLASIGLPGLAGFVGEFLILLGSYGAPSLVYSGWFVGLALVGIVLGATYMLSVVERIFWGGVRFEENRHLPDLRWDEALTLAVPLILVVWLGIQPGIVLQRISPAVDQMTARMNVPAEETERR